MSSSIYLAITEGVLNVINPDVYTQKVLVRGFDVSRLAPRQNALLLSSSCGSYPHLTP